jgi:hypothetical protein
LVCTSDETNGIIIEWAVRITHSSQDNPYLQAFPQAVVRAKPALVSVPAPVIPMAFALEGLLVLAGNHLLGGGKSNI